MKIAIITPTLSGRGGEETVISRIMQSTNIRKNDLQIQLIILGKSYTNDWVSGFYNHVSITNTENEVINFGYLLKNIHQEKYKKIICLSRKSILYSNLIRKILMTNYTIYSWIHFNLEKVNTRFLKLADFHLAISDEIHDQLINRKIGNKNNVFTIYNPVDYHKNIIKRSFNNKLIYIGRVTFKGQKDIKELIDNVAYLPFKNWSLKIIGDGKDRRRCQEYLLKYYPNIKDKVSWEGWEKNPWKSIDSADTLILTSLYEGLPMVLLEAISRGLPCLASQVDGPTSVIQPSVNGELYKKGDKHDFSIKLHKNLERHYNIDLMKKSIDKFYADKYINRFINVMKKN